MTDDQGSPNVLKAIQTVSSKAHEVFPDIPIFPAFGNNDIPGHYVLPINRSDPWYVRDRVNLLGAADSLSWLPQRCPKAYYNGRAEKNLPGWRLL